MGPPYTHFSLKTTRARSAVAGGGRPQPHPSRKETGHHVCSRTSADQEHDSIFRALLGPPLDMCMELLWGRRMLPATFVPALRPPLVRQGQKLGWPRLWRWLWR